MRKRAIIAECLGGGASKGFADIGYMRAREETGLAQEYTDKGGVSTGSIWTSFMSEDVISKYIVEYVHGNQNELSKGLYKKELSKILSLPNSKHKYGYNLVREFSKILPANNYYEGLSSDENGYFVSDDGKKLPRTGIGNTDILEKFLREFIGRKKFRDMTDLTVFGTDMRTGELLPFNYKTTPDMDVAEGVIISCSGFHS